MIASDAHNSSIETTMINLEKVSSNKQYGGTITKYKFKVNLNTGSQLHASLLTALTQSAALGGLDTSFNIFLPANAAKGKVPVLFYLAGLTCTEDNGYARHI